MTDYKNEFHKGMDALRALCFFILMLFVIAVCLDVGYLNAKKYEIQKGLEIAAYTGVMGLPNTHAARSLTLNVANSQGLALYPHELMIDPNGKWLQIDKRAYYETMFLCHIGINRIPINVHIFDF